MLFENGLPCLKPGLNSTLPQKSKVRIEKVWTKESIGLVKEDSMNQQHEVIRSEIL